MVKKTPSGSGWVILVYLFFASMLEVFLAWKVYSNFPRHIFKGGEEGLRLEDIDWAASCGLLMALVLVSAIFVVKIVQTARQTGLNLWQAVFVADYFNLLRRN